MQNLKAHTWRINTDLDDMLPESECRDQHQFLMPLKSINNIKFGRSIIIEQLKSVEIHGFVDASERCYEAAAY